MRKFPRRARVSSSAACAALLAAWTLTSSVRAGPADPLKDKDPAIRAAAIDAVAAAAGKDAETTLIAALGDGDWEVVERAASGLGACGGPRSVKHLATLAIDGPIRRVRNAAARSLSKLDANATVAVCAKAIEKDGAVRAFDALDAMCEGAPNDAAAALVEAAVEPPKRRPKERSGPRERDPGRAAAARAFHVVAPAKRVALLARLATDGDVAVACAALDEAAARPDAGYAPALLSALCAPQVHESVQRRIYLALRAILAARRDGEPALDLACPALAAGPTERVLRLVRLHQSLAAAPTAGSTLPKPAANVVAAALTTLAPFATHADPRVRASAAAALGRIAAPDCAEPLLRLAKDADARTRAAAVRGLAAVPTAGDDRALIVLVTCLGDADPQVRGEAAVALGVPGASEAIPALAKAVDGVAAARGDAADWRLATSALVSMGKIRDVAAGGPLRKTLHDAFDWKLRASAAAGLAYLRLAVAVPDLVEALDDKAPCVRATALEALQATAGRVAAAEAKAWRAWWKANEKGFVPLPAAPVVVRAPTAAYDYENLDVLVVAGNCFSGATETFDIEKIAYRHCWGGEIAVSGLHPGAFVWYSAMPTGTDLETVAWFVHAGGLVASGGWIYDEFARDVAGDTIHGAYDTVTRESGSAAVRPVAPCAPCGPYLDGVFEPAFAPVRCANPRSCIEVTDADRVDVWIDSVELSAEYGRGDFACSVRVGHGTVVHMAADLNGFSPNYYLGLKTPEDRAAFAVDHMGVDYAAARRLRAKRVFESVSLCATEVVDRWPLRFVTNFVRAHRRAGP